MVSIGSNLELGAIRLSGASAPTPTRTTRPTGASAPSAEALRSLSLFISSRDSLRLPGLRPFVGHTIDILA